MILAALLILILLFLLFGGLGIWISPFFFIVVGIVVLVALLFGGVSGRGGWGRRY